METTVDAEGTERSRTALAALAALGIAYVIAGLGLFYGLAVDSMPVFTTALTAILVLLAVSMVVVRNELFVSRENAAISVCIFVAMALFFGSISFTALPVPVRVVVLVFVGAVLPGLDLQYGPSILD